MEDLRSQLLNMMQQSNLKEFEGTYEKMVNAFQDWIIRRATCRVTYVWTDLGEFFWPRYLKVGHCGTINSTDSDSKDEKEGQHHPVLPQIVDRGCSFPDGMKCRQDNIEVFHLLRWHCKTKNQKSTKDRNLTITNHSNRRRCQWYKVPYPVTLSCKCSCSNKIK